MPKMPKNDLCCCHTKRRMDWALPANPFGMTTKRRMDWALPANPFGMTTINKDVKSHFSATRLIFFYFLAYFVLHFDWDESLTSHPVSNLCCLLLQHCLAGWECSQPSMIPTASTLDLKHNANGAKGQLITVSFGIVPYFVQFSQS